MDEIGIGTWVRILEGAHIGRRGMVIAADGAEAVVQVELLVEGRLPVATLPKESLRLAGKQSARSLGVWRAEHAAQRLSMAEDSHG